MNNGFYDVISRTHILRTSCSQGYTYINKILYEWIRFNVYGILMFIMTFVNEIQCSPSCKARMLRGGQ